MDENIIATLERHGVRSSDSTIIQKDNILRKVQNLLLKTKINQFNILDVLLTGSHGLGVGGNNSDIDLLCIGPPEIPPRHFYNTAMGVLEQSDGFEYLHNALNAKVPTMKVSIDGVEFDIGYLRLYQLSTNMNLHDQMMRDDIFEKIGKSRKKIKPGALIESCTTIRTYRENQMILQSIKSHEEKFRLVLQFIKLWARNNGIYDKSLGYLNGVTCAILAASLIKTNPNSSVFKLLQMFFQENWSSTPLSINNVQLSDYMKEGNLLESTKLDCIWESKEEDIMNVLSPSHPQDNKTEMITRQSLSIMEKKKMEASEIMKNILQSSESIDRLFEYELNNEDYCKIKIQKNGKVRRSLNRDNKIIMFYNKVAFISEIGNTARNLTYYTWNSQIEEKTEKESICKVCPICFHTFTTTRTEKQGWVIVVGPPWHKFFGKTILACIDHHEKSLQGSEEILSWNQAVTDMEEDRNQVDQNLEYGTQKYRAIEHNAGIPEYPGHRAKDENFVQKHRHFIIVNGSLAQARNEWKWLQEYKATIQDNLGSPNSVDISTHLEFVLNPDDSTKNIFGFYQYQNTFPIC